MQAQSPLDRQEPPGSEKTITVTIPLSVIGQLKALQQRVRTTLPFLDLRAFEDRNSTNSTRVEDEAPTPNSIKVVWGNYAADPWPRFPVSTAKLPLTPLVLDIDETLIFAREAGDKLGIPKPDYEFGLGPTTFRLKIRPGAIELFKSIENKFEVWVYSNGNSEYVQVIVEFLAKKGLKIDPKKVLSRENNTEYKKKVLKYDELTAD